MGEKSRIILKYGMYGVIVFQKATRKPVRSPVIVQEDRGVVVFSFLFGIAVLQKDLAVIEQGLGHGAGNAFTLSRKEAIFFPEIEIA